MALAGIAGNRELIAALEAEIARRPAHAYLFAGPRGVGKAIVAAGIAHEILCERGQGSGFCCDPLACPVRAAAAAPTGRTRGANPAGRCECCSACVQVAMGVHPDFVRIARLPNRSDVLIEQVRDLIEKLGVRPARGPRRVAIIDDAETLNLPAQNALLKTLEEPPGHTIIFLIAQSERALLETVRSRLRPVRFAPLEPAEIATVLEKRAGLDPQRALDVARLARGSAARAFEMAAGEEPPSAALLAALERAAALDFPAIQALAQEFFGAREQAVENFELIARLIEEMLCSKLLDSNSAAASRGLAGRAGAETLAVIGDAALDAAAAVEAMANPRLQAERFWLEAGRALRGE
jgi:DNA polymerase-3 subunit delta'